MKGIIFFVIALCILSSCNEKSDEDIFFSKLSDIVANETWLIDQNDTAIDKVIKLIEDNPASLDYPIRPLKAVDLDLDRKHLIDITTSDDGNVRVYNVGNIVLDGNRSFGPDGRWIIQYRIDGTVYTDVWDNKYSAVTYIHSVQSSTKTYYLFVDYSSYIRQGEFMDEAITAYSINPRTHKFQKERLFKTIREFLSSIDISWIDCDYTGDDMIYSELHHIYCVDEELHIPLVTNNGIMTEGYLQYVWDGCCFQYKGVRPIVEFTVNNHHIRIDIMSDGSYQYKSWDNGRTTNQTPNLEIKNGIMECWDELGICHSDKMNAEGTSAILGRRYCFKNKEYTYNVEIGWFKGTFIKNLSIYKGEELVQSKCIDSLEISPFL